MKTSAIVATLVVACLLVGTSCKRSESSSTTAAPGTFRFINRGDVITLDINTMSYLQDFRVTYAIREGLYTYDPTQNFKPLPALVVSDAVSDDKRTWTFKIRDGAKWTNGDPVTARDFVFSWRHMLESPGEYTYLFYYIKNAEAYEQAHRDGGDLKFEDVGIAAIDDHTLQVTLNDPVPFLRDLLAFPPFYPRHAASMEKHKQTDSKGRVSYDAAYTRPENVVTNGPFQLVEWAPGQRLMMTKSPSYWDAANVELERVEMVVNNDPQSAFVQYDQKKVDWLADVAADLAFEAKAAGREDLRITPAFGTAFLTVNCGEQVPELGSTKNPLADQRVREALARSINKQYIVDNITRMGEPVAQAYVPPGFFEGYTSTPTPGYDLEAARRLLADAGYAAGRGMPTLSIAYNSDNPTRKALAEFLAFEWRDKLGIPVDLRPLELKTYRNYITTKQYTLGLAAWYGDYMDVSTFTDKYRSTALNNDSNWGPPKYDELLLQASKEPDERKRLELLMQAEAMINTDLPIMPLYHYVNTSMHRDNVLGSLSNPKNLVVWKEIDIKR
jgi:oligopeptide transport system substrate-binding protein